MTWKRVLWERHGGGATARGEGAVEARLQRGVRKPYGGEIQLRMDSIDKHLNLFWENVTI